MHRFFENIQTKYFAFLVIALSAITLTTPAEAEQALCKVCYNGNCCYFAGTCSQDGGLVCCDVGPHHCN